MRLKRMEIESRSYLLLAAAPCCTVQWTMQHPSQQCEWILIYSYCSLKQCFFFEKPVNSFFFWKTSAVNWFHSHCSREYDINFYFFKKMSLSWIKFIHTVISILFLIIFYLILLHALKIIETVVLVGWILYVIKL
jgi:hypothetical protein